MGKHKKQYSAEFKQDAVDYYHSSGKSLEQVAGDLKVSKSALSKWVASAKKMMVLLITEDLAIITQTLKKKLPV